MKTAEVLNLRYEWEEIVRKNYVLPKTRKHGTIENLKHFIKHGAQKNRFRNNFKRAIELAEKIVGESNGPRKSGTGL